MNLTAQGWQDMQTAAPIAPYSFILGAALGATAIFSERTCQSL